MVTVLEGDVVTQGGHGCGPGARGEAAAEAALLHPGDCQELAVRLQQGLRRLAARRHRALPAGLQVILEK